jgi:hypothetical protein
MSSSIMTISSSPTRTPSGRRAGRQRRSHNQSILTVPVSEEQMHRLNRAFNLLSQPLPQGHSYIRDNLIYRISQSVEFPANQATSTTVPTFATYAFQLSQVDQVSQLTAIFDQYKIECIEFWLIPHTPDNVTAATNPGLMTTVIDYDDANALSTIGQALDYTNAITASGLSGHYRVFRPHVATAAYSGAFTAYANETAPWLDAASTTVQHYGIKTACSATTAVQTYDAMVRFHLAFRNIR